MKREESIKVFVRVRPPIYKEVKLDNAVFVRGNQSVAVSTDSKEISCNYDYVFGELSEQQQIFEKIQPVLIDVLSGINACVFCYGQTSSGKSYTMIGPDGGQDVLKMERKDWGVLPRAADFLLNYLNDKSEEEVYISGLSEFRVQTSDDIMRILAIGTSNRMTRSTDFNLTSSRSHALLQLTFEIETQVESGQTLMARSKLFLVDLAGSEKIPYVANDNPKHIKELTSINKSLSTLGNVISALATSNRSHIPYRESKLTRILQDSLGGNTRTILIACVAPTIVHSSETLSTLQFADRAKNVKPEEMSETVSRPGHLNTDHNFYNDPYHHPPAITTPSSPPSTNPSARLPYPTPHNNFLQSNPNEPDVLQIARHHTNSLTNDIEQQPNNRIFIRKGGNNSNNNQEPNSSRNRPNLPPVVDSNSSVAHSANLFANAVNMYNNVNRFTNNMNRANPQSHHHSSNNQQQQIPGGNGYPPSYPQPNSNNNSSYNLQPNPSNYSPQGYPDDPYRQTNGQQRNFQSREYPPQHPPSQQQQQQRQLYPPAQQPGPTSINGNQQNSRDSMRENKNVPIVLPHQFANNNNNNQPPISSNGNANKTTANLTFTMDDIGRAIELFSFRLNTWERIDLIDFEQAKRQYKVQFPDGSIQWLDLTKKPTRSLHDEVSYRH
eukprot:gene4365-4679_t